jgi:hypothetical protein
MRQPKTVQQGAGAQEVAVLKKAVLLLTKSLVNGNPMVHSDGFGGSCRCGDCETVRLAREIATR